VAITVSTLAWGQGKIDAGVLPIATELAQHKAESSHAHAVIRSELAQLQRSSIRTEAMLEMVLRSEGLTPPPRQVVIPQSDGGP